MKTGEGDVFYSDYISYYFFKEFKYSPKFFKMFDCYNKAKSTIIISYKRALYVFTTIE